MSGNPAAMIFACVADAGGVPLARVPKGNHDYIKRVLDAGAYGIVVPMVDTPQQAQTAYWLWSNCQCGKARWNRSTPMTRPCHWLERRCGRPL